MKRIIRSFLSLVFVLVALSVTSVARSNEGLDQLNQFIDSLSTFKADFEQTLYAEDSTPLQVSKGNLTIKKPGRFIWNYLEPQQQQIIADGEKIWMYDIELEQVTVNDISERTAGSPLAVLVGEAEITEEFEIAELGLSEGINWLELKPRSANADFELVFLGLGAEGLAVMELRDNFGQATQILFSNKQSGLPLSDDLFEFTPPEGVDVIGLDG